MFKLKLVLCLVVISVGLAAAKLSRPPIKSLPLVVEPETRADEEVSYRLPNNTSPIHYDISLTTNVHQVNFRFDGVVKIQLVVLQTSASITLHHRQLTISSINLFNQNAPTVAVPIGAHTYDNVTEFLTIPVINPLRTGDVLSLEIVYVGELREDLAGFYRSSYPAPAPAPAGTRRWLATTQFEQTDARHAFPCYDEPSFRAEFTIRIRHGSAYNAISNMPVDGTPVNNNDGTVTTHFQKLLSTPTYLIAFIVSDFAYKSNEANVGAFPHRVYAPAYEVEGAEFAVGVGFNILKSFEEHLKVPFTLPKMDQAVVPDFSAGAMENWGLVTYREEYLLYFENSTTFQTVNSLVTVIAHEFAHQWFGDLVTPKWWTYIWLNEGFATVMEHYATDWVYPDWKILDAFVSDTLQNVMQPDAAPGIRPMTHYVESPRGVSGLFDNIAYDKSGTVLRMFINAFTEETFFKGLNYYLNDLRLKAAVEEDLFRGLEKAVKEDRQLDASLNVATIMLSWTRQSGFPILHAHRNYTTGSIHLSQQRYFTSQTETSNSLWWIPYNFATPSSSDFAQTKAEAWLPPNAAGQTISPDNLKKWTNDDWIVLNKQSTGYYRVMYDERNYQLIAAQLKEDLNKIHLTSRSQIIDDIYEFARTKRLSYEIFFDVIRYLDNELEYVPWATAFKALNVVNRLFAGSDKYDLFSKFVATRVTKLYNFVGLEDKPTEPHYHKQSRINAINWACKFGVESCLNATNEKLLQSGHHQNVRGAIYCNGIRSATEEQYVSIFKLLQSTTNVADRNRLILGLGCSSNRTFLVDFINTSVASSESEINYLTELERFRAFSGVVENGQLGLSVAIQFLLDNLDVVNSLYGNGYLLQSLTNTASYVVTEEVATEFNKVITLARTKQYVPDATVTRLVQIIAENKVWKDDNEVVIENWLKEWDASSSTTLSISIVTIAFSVFTAFRSLV